MTKNSIKLGTRNQLKVVEINKEGYSLENKNGVPVFLAKAECLQPLELEDTINVFVYTGKNHQLLATMHKPKVELEHFAFLKVKDSTAFGVFMDWGISKDIFVPYAEQTTKMHVGESYLIFLFLDKESNRLIGSCKEEDFLLFDKERIDLTIGDQVDLLLFNPTELGINAIVNNKYKGLIFKSDIHKKVHPGDHCKGYVKKIRDDGMLDIALEPLGYKNSIDATVQIILQKLEQSKGTLYLTDKSLPESIKNELGLSKKAFKRGIGNLYKQKKIVILEDRIQKV